MSRPRSASDVRSKRRSRCGWSLNGLGPLPAKMHRSGPVLGGSAAAALAALILVGPSLSNGCSNWTFLPQSPPRSILFASVAPLHASWKQVTVAGAHPPHVNGGSMAFDPVDGYVVLFGGETGHGYASNQTWTYKGGVWTRLNLTVAPSPRSGASLAFDPFARHLVLFGGESTNSSSQGCSGTLAIWTFCNDTWSFIRGKWTLLHPAVSPPVRTDAAMAWDAASRSLMTGGGFGTASSCGWNCTDLWEFANRTWTQLIGPTYRNFTEPFNGPFGALGFDPRDHYLVYFGGPAYKNNSYFNSTWNYVGGKWAHLKTATNPLNINYYNTPLLAWDPGLHSVVFFGGGSGSTTSGRNQTWALAGGAWTNLNSNLTNGPNWGGTLSWDGADKCLLLFGGEYVNRHGYGVLLSTTWAFS